MVTEPVRAVCGGPPIHTDHQVAVQEHLGVGRGRQRTGCHELQPHPRAGGCGGDRKPWTQPGLDLSFPEWQLQSAQHFCELCSEITHLPHGTANAVPATVASGEHTGPAWRNLPGGQNSTSPREAEAICLSGCDYGGVQHSAGRGSRLGRHLKETACGCAKAPAEVTGRGLYLTQDRAQARGSTNTWATRLQA